MVRRTSKLLLGCLTAAGLLPALQGHASAFLNERPFLGMDLVAAQAILDAVAGPGALDATGDQSPHAVFTARAFTATLVYEHPWIDTGDEGFDYGFDTYEALAAFPQSGFGLPSVTGAFLQQTLDPEAPMIVDIDAGATASLDAGGQWFGLSFFATDLCCGDDEFTHSQDDREGYNGLRILSYQLGSDDFLFMTTYDAQVDQEPTWAVRLQGVTAVVPEPSTGLLLGVGLALLARRRPRQPGPPRSSR